MGCRRAPRCASCWSCGSGRWLRSRNSWCILLGWSGPSGTYHLCTDHSEDPGRSPAGGTHTHTHTQQCQTHKHDRLVYVCAFVYVSANLAETLSCGRVTHFLLGPRLVAVTWSAVGVTVETGGTAVALTSDDVVLTSGNRKRRAESQLL